MTVTRSNPPAVWPGIKAFMAQEPRDYEKNPLTDKERAEAEAYRHVDGWGRDTRQYGWTPEQGEQEDAEKHGRLVNEAFERYPDGTEKERLDHVMRGMRGMTNPSTVREQIRQIADAKKQGNIAYASGWNVIVVHPDAL